MSLIGERCTRRERHSASGVADARADFAALQRLPCFWPEATRASAEAALSAATGDCCLVRLSSQPNHLTVSYRASSTTRCCASCRAALCSSRVAAIVHWHRHGHGLRECHAAIRRPLSAPLASSGSTKMCASQCGQYSSASSHSAIGGRRNTFLHDLHAITISFACGTRRVAVVNTCVPPKNHKKKKEKEKFGGWRHNGARARTCCSSWSAFSWWHAGQSNHFLQHGARIAAFAFFTCLHMLARKLRAELWLRANGCVQVCAQQQWQWQCECMLQRKYDIFLQTFFFVFLFLHSRSNQVS